MQVVHIDPLFGQSDLHMARMNGGPTSFFKGKCVIGLPHPLNRGMISLCDDTWQAGLLVFSVYFQGA